MIDGRKMDRAGYRVAPGEKITVSPKARNFEIVNETWKHPAHERPSWMVHDAQKMQVELTSVPSKDTLLFPIDVNLVIEYYAKRM